MSYLGTPEEQAEFIAASLPPTQPKSALVVAIEGVAEGLLCIADALNKLGVSDANTPMGAVELLSKEIKEGFERLSDATLRQG